MKLSLLILLTALLFASCSSVLIKENKVATEENLSKNKEESTYQYWIDENDSLVEKDTFLKRWRNQDNLLSRWDYIKKDSGRVARLDKDLYQTANLEYSEVKKSIEDITGRKYDDKSIFLLNFTYYDDLCSHSSSNAWTKSNIERIRSFEDPIKRKVERKHKNVVVLQIFEKGVTLEKTGSSKNEYFFADKKGDLRKLIFHKPSLCGSYAIIKPNGQTLVRNGEYRKDMMAQHLKPETWHIFFPD